MKKYLLDSRMLLAALTLFVFVFALQMAEPASAAKWKKFDKGSHINYDSSENLYYRTVWKAYKKNKNYVKVRYYNYWLKYPNKKYYGTTYYKKISKTKLKTIIIYGYKQVKYTKTKRNAVQHYRYKINKMYSNS